MKNKKENVTLNFGLNYVMKANFKSILRLGLKSISIYPSLKTCYENYFMSKQFF